MTHANKACDLGGKQGKATLNERPRVGKMTSGKRRERDEDGMNIDVKLDKQIKNPETVMGRGKGQHHQWEKGQRE